MQEKRNCLGLWNESMFKELQIWSHQFSKS